MTTLRRFKTRGGGYHNDSAIFNRARMRRSDELLLFLPLD
jgi:hypothetical protein